MGLRDVLFGKKKLSEPKTDRLFALATAAVTLDTEISPATKAARLSIHLVDESGTDRGALQEVQVSN